MYFNILLSLRDDIFHYLIQYYFSIQYRTFENITVIISFQIIIHAIFRFGLFDRKICYE